MTNTIKLSGCSPIPLANYLKALGILRLVAEQADPTVRGVWQDESFVLNTSLSAEELVEFFLTTYQPSPIVSPWNGGSGFLKNDKRVAPLLRHFETSSLPRLIRYQEGIKAARSLCKALSLAKQIEVEVKAESNQIKDKTAKERLRNDPEYKNSEWRKQLRNGYDLLSVPGNVLWLWALVAASAPPSVPH